MVKEDRDWPGRETLPSGGRWPVGLGHDHVAVAVNYRWPILLLGGPSEIFVPISDECAVKLSSQS